ncbi:MAG TPA: GAF domain-containing protein [Aggregatilineales bacterium]|nr:GAF domain-containing protein [Aggregatilineales bacterium]
MRRTRTSRRSPERDTHPASHLIMSLGETSRAMAAAPDLHALLQAFVQPFEPEGLCEAHLFYAGGDSSAQVAPHVAAAAPRGGSPPPLVEQIWLPLATDGADPACIEFPDLDDDATGLDEALTAAIRQRGGRAAVVLPLGAGGAAVLFWLEARALLPDERDLLAILGPQLAALTANHVLSQQLQAQTGFRDSVLQALPVGLAILDRDLRMLQLNPRCAAILGYQREELAGRSISDLLARPHDVQNQRHFDAVVNQGSIVRYETTGVRQDESRFPMRLHLSPIRGVREEIVGVLATIEDMSLHRETEAALHESRQMLEQVMDNIPQAIFWKDRNSVFLGCNRTFAIHAGLNSPLDIVGLTDYDMPWGAEHAEAYREADQRVIQTGQPELDVVEPQLQANGVRAWLRTSKLPLRDSTGEIVGVLGTYEDITEWREMQAAEREQRSLAEALRATAVAINSTLDLEEVLDRVLENLGRVVPHDAANVMLIEGDCARVVRSRRFFKSPLGTWPSDEPFSIDETPTLREMVRRRRPICISNTDTDPGWIRHERTAWIRSHLAAPIIVDDEVIGILNADSTRPGVFTPTDAERLMAFADQAAIALKNARLYAAAREHNRRLQVLNRITEVGTATLDVQELVETLAGTAASVINADYCQITLWDDDQQMAVPVATSEQSRQVPHRNVRVEPANVVLTRKVLDTGRPLVIPDVHNTSTLPDRLPQPLLNLGGARALLVMPLQIVERRIGALLMAFNEPHNFDDDEVAWAEQVAELTALAIAKAQAYAVLEERVAQRTAELMQANQRLLEMGRLKDEFVSNVSHELRTPIASIKLYHHLLTARPEKQAAYLERLHRETDRLEMIIEDLLYLSRMDQGEAALQLAVIDVNKLVSLYLTDREPLAERRDLTLKARLGSNVPLASGDTLALGRAIDVLLTNALTYTPPGGEVIIQTNFRERDGVRGVEIRVCDSGPGIPPEERSRIFERFFRGQAGRASGAPGTGLGLAIARQIVERHGGLMMLDDSCHEGQGACFVIWLPEAGGKD